MKHFWPITKPLLAEPGGEFARIDVRDIQFIEVQNRHVAYVLPSSTFLEVSDSVAVLLRGGEGGDGRLADVLQAAKAQLGTEVVAEIQDDLRVLARLGVFHDRRGRDARPSSVTVMNLNLTRNCNLKCVYCFASPAESDTGIKVMSMETARAALAMLMRLSGASARGLNVVFFGGEPLLCFGRMKEIVQLGREFAQKHGKKITYDVFTNGTELTEEIIQYLKHNEIRVLLSLDGKQPTNDRLRPFKHKSASSYDAVMRHRDQLLTLDPKRLLIRSTLTSDHHDWRGFVCDMASLGFKNFVIEFAVKSGADRMTPEEEGRAFKKELLACAESFESLVRQGVKINVISEPIMKILNPGTGGYDRNHTTCPAGRGFLVVSPEGNVYPCHYLADNERWRMGSVHLNNVRPKSMVEENGVTDLNKQAVCGDCWLRGPLCGGPCPHKVLDIEADVRSFLARHCSKEESKYRVALSVLMSLYPHRNYPFISDWNRHEQRLLQRP